MKYQWKGRTGLKGSAEDVAKYIESLGKNVTPELLLKKAKAKRSPLHDYFEWDDTTAAKKYRIQQAAYILRSIEILIESDGDEPVRVRAFVNVNEEQKSVYTTVTRARQEPELWEQVKEKALQELVNWQRVYKHISEFEIVFAAIEGLRK